MDPRTVSQWARRGLIATVTTPGGQRRYRETDVRALLEGAASPPGSSLSDEDDQEAETVSGNAQAVNGQHRAVGVGRAVWAAANQADKGDHGS